jgi:PAS domain S-box-containing protein
VATDEVHFSERWSSIIGYRSADIGTRPDEWFSRIHPEDLARVRGDIDAHLKGLTPHFESEHRMQHKTGTFRWVLARGLATRDAAGVVTRIAGSLSDITEGKVMDALTGLPNRTLLLDRLARALERSGRRDHEPFAVLFLDLDEFKVVNDSLGHQAGDELLKAVSSRLEASLRNTDVVTRVDGMDEPTPQPVQHTLARVGGDEFIVLLHNIGGVMNATRVADRIHQSLARPIQVAGREVFTSASIGITMSQAGTRGPDELLRDADTAMYRAKAIGKGRTEVFDVAMREQVVRQLHLDTAVRRAFERREFVPYFQPLIELATDEVVGFEALIRWQHPEKGIVAPSQFLPMLQENGLALPVGQQFIRDVCQHLRKWTTAGGRGRALWANVNFSSRELLDENLTTRLLECLDDHQLEPCHLVVEITESTVIDDFARMARIVAELQQAGIRVVMDDFGTGYSSLACLHELPLSGLKLDPTFARGTARRMEIVKAVVGLARNLGLTVTAEGIETREAHEQVRALGCHFGQGYLFAPALPPEQAEEAIHKGTGRHWSVRRPA